MSTGSAHDASGTMPISGSAAATTPAADMLLSAPSSSVRMRATFSTNDMRRDVKKGTRGAVNSATWRPQQRHHGLRICPEPARRLRILAELRFLYS